MSSTPTNPRKQSTLVTCKRCIGMGQRFKYTNPTPEFPRSSQERQRMDLKEALQEAIEWLIELGADDTHENARRIENLASALAPEGRAEKTVKYLDERIDHMALRPRMYGEHLSGVELEIAHLLDIRARLIGVERSFWREFCNEKFPEIPGPIRSITAASKQDNSLWTQRMQEFVVWSRKIVASYDIPE